MTLRTLSQSKCLKWWCRFSVKILIFLCLFCPKLTVNQVLNDLLPFYHTYLGCMNTVHTVCWQIKSPRICSSSGTCLEFLLELTLLIIYCAILVFLVPIDCFWECFRNVFQVKLANDKQFSAGVNVNVVCPQI